MQDTLGKEPHIISTSPETSAPEVMLRNPGSTCKGHAPTTISHTPKVKKKSRTTVAKWLAYDICTTSQKKKPLFWPLRREISSKYRDIEAKE